MSQTARSARRSLRRAAVALLTFGVLAAGGGTAYGVLGVELDDLSLDRLTGDRDADARPRPAAAPPRPASDTPAEQPLDAPAPRPAPPAPSDEPVAPPVLEPGDSGLEVRELQARLAQLAWFPPMTTGTYGPGTRTAVRGFQEKRGFEATGVVDRRTWNRLVRMSTEPTRAQLLNKPGPRLFGAGDDGRAVREIEARLRQIAWFFGDVDDVYDARTVEAVRGFQAKRGIPVTGAVDRRTLDLLEGMTVEPSADSLANRPYDPADGAPLDPRCLAVARALCIDKSTNSLRYVVDGKVRTAVDVRFGSAELPTREGVFSVYRKSRDHVSSLYDTSMPFAMFFSGGQAVHYSPDFAANGYSGASHGCVNVRDYTAIAALFDQVPLGTRVVVHWS
ncbi:MAG TPA: peptidoglycan-binding protein [Nocardioides sp.]|nr:peptidoglycan-binding protein [Nocardioides sp.]